MHTSKRFLERAAQLRESYHLAGLVHLGCPERVVERPKPAARPENAPQRGISFSVLLVGGFMHGKAKDIHAGSLTQAAKDVFTALGQNDLAASLGDVRTSVSPTGNMLSFLFRFDTDRTARLFGRNPAGDELLQRLQQALILAAGVRCTARKPRVEVPSRPTGSRLAAVAYNSLDVEALEDAMARASITAETYGVQEGREALAEMLHESAEAFARAQMEAPPKVRERVTSAPKKVPKAHTVTQSSAKQKKSTHRTEAKREEAGNKKRSRSRARRSRKNLQTQQDVCDLSTANCTAVVLPDTPPATPEVPEVPVLTEAPPAESIDTATAIIAVEPSTELETAPAVETVTTMSGMSADLAAHLALLAAAPSSDDSGFASSSSNEHEDMASAAIPEEVDSQTGPPNQESDGERAHSDNGGESPMATSDRLRAAVQAARPVTSGASQRTIEAFCLPRASPPAPQRPAVSPERSYHEAAASPPAPRRSAAERTRRLTRAVLARGVPTGPN